MLMVYMAFCEFMNGQFNNPSLSLILAYIECLAYNGLQHVSIVNYVSTIRVKFQWFAINAEVLYHSKVKYILKTIRKGHS